MSHFCFYNKSAEIYVSKCVKSRLIFEYKQLSRFGHETITKIDNLQ